MLGSILIFVGGLVVGFLAGVGALTWRMKSQAENTMEELANQMQEEVEDEMD